MIYIKKIVYAIPVGILVAIFIYSNTLESFKATEFVFNSLYIYIIFMLVMAYLARYNKKLYIPFLINVFSFTVCIVVYFTVVLGLFVLWEE